MADAGDRRRMLRIIARMRRRGAVVETAPGWENRGRTFAVVPRGIMVHHDASSTRSGRKGAWRTILYGRPDVSGPLSQFQVFRGGPPGIGVAAAGRANHSGQGGPITLAGRRIFSGSRELYGMEAADNGVDEVRHPEHLRARAILCAAVVSELDEHYNTSYGARRVTRHRDWAPRRKIDPRDSLASLRAQITAELRLSTGTAVKGVKAPREDGDGMRVFKNGPDEYLVTPVMVDKLDRHESVTWGNLPREVVNDVELREAKQAAAKARDLIARDVAALLLDELSSTVTRAVTAATEAATERVAVRDAEVILDKFSERIRS